MNLPLKYIIEIHNFALHVIANYICLSSRVLMPGEDCLSINYMISYRFATFCIIQRLSESQVCHQIITYFWDCFTCYDIHQQIRKSPWGGVSYRPSASPANEASSHVNTYAYSGKLILLLLESTSLQYYHVILCVLIGYITT